MDEFGYIVAAVGVLATVAAVGAWAFGSGRGSRAYRRAKKRGLQAAVGDYPPEPAHDSATPSNSALLEHSKLVIHALLHSISEGIESLALASTKYGDALERHKASVGKAITIASIKELERVMLKELDEIQRANKNYRRQLDTANERIKRQQEELEQLQTDLGVDFLTKIANRRSLDSRIVEEVTRAKRYGKTFSLVIFDIDHFKDVNDIYGHIAGDRVLRAVAKILDEQKRASDFLARYGGEEFALILPETSASQAETLVKRAAERVAHARFRCENKSIWVTVSAGVGEVVPETDTAETLFGRVDRALYHAKEQGRNRVEVAATPAG
ncbi:MAG TPA: diguanylate cyclase [Candidatus Hydrogenedentes bacterium]|nr:diguanylate cyclase [Candidatus Hydrogenedentota bacterium]